MYAYKSVMLVSFMVFQCKHLFVQKQLPRDVVWKMCSLKFHKVHRKTPGLDSLFLIKFQASTCKFIKKEVFPQVFFWEFCEILKSTSFIEQLWWLLLFVGTDAIASPLQRVFAWSKLPIETPNQYLKYVQK